MGVDNVFWNGRRVLITGHTGFKGSWLSYWLSKLGANVRGYSLEPSSAPNLFTVLGISECADSVIGDIRNSEALKRSIVEFKPEIVIHMAAQAIVMDSYKDPIETFQTNIIGTANLLEAIRDCGSVKAVVCVTSDKCYENREWDYKYREIDSMGGWDPYSSSKGCAELVIASYRRSFFRGVEGSHHAAIASARAGNVIGGGDWSNNRLIPDIIRSFKKKTPVVIRNPAAIRPWQYILDLLHGYILLAEKLYNEPENYSEAWNFGPSDDDEKSVEYITEKMIDAWGKGASWTLDEGANPHEASYLKLDSSKARMHLKWASKMNLDNSLTSLTNWYKNYYQGADMKKVSGYQLDEFQERIE
ncbi:MAG: CDP-glucose 4,6-dehydratase [Bacteroidetes bacterium]|jgi:CDP-glucose 4,6-dehydratase|nr:CDP-glucose 4,6-dehydratase [Bacteroidota bacterium]